MSCEPWPVVWPCPTDGIDPELIAGAESLAGQLLWALSGYRIGVCDYTEAYRPSPATGCVGPVNHGYGRWTNSREGDCCRILLTHRPLVAVVSVWEYGILLDPDDYDTEGGYLRRKGACWPSAPICDDPPVAVAYSAGVPFPAGAGVAAGEVACEYLTALQGGQCRLPSRATSITRQGVTVTLDTAADFVKRGRIGLPVTDAWLETVVGNGPRIASRVYSPDLARGIPAVVVVGP